jgi:hypothetical protein
LSNPLLFFFLVSRHYRELTCVGLGEETRATNPSLTALRSSSSFFRSRSPITRARLKSEHITATTSVASSCLFYSTTAQTKKNRNGSGQSIFNKFMTCRLFSNERRGNTANKRAARNTPRMGDPQRGGAWHSAGIPVCSTQCRRAWQLPCSGFQLNGKTDERKNENGSERFLFLSRSRTKPHRQSA